MGAPRRSPWPRSRCYRQRDVVVIRWLLDIDGTLASAEERHPTWREIRRRPHVLDDATVARTRRVYTKPGLFPCGVPQPGDVPRRLNGLPGAIQPTKQV
jgi:hypothetical protein